MPRNKFETVAQGRVCDPALPCPNTAGGNMGSHRVSGCIDGATRHSSETAQSNAPGRERQSDPPDPALNSLACTTVPTYCNNFIRVQPHQMHKIRRKISALGIAQLYRAPSLHRYATPMRSVQKQTIAPLLRHRLPVVALKGHQQSHHMGRTINDRGVHHHPFCPGGLASAPPRYRSPNTAPRPDIANQCRRRHGRLTNCATVPARQIAI